MPSPTPAPRRTHRLGVAVIFVIQFASSAAVAVVLVSRLINFWLPIPAGLASYLSLR